MKKDNKYFGIYIYIYAAKKNFSQIKNNMRKTLLLVVGLFAATASWADVVDFITGESTLKVYQIQARRGPNAVGTGFDENSGKGFMLTNADDESDYFAYSNWFKEAEKTSKFYNTTYDAANKNHNFLIVKTDLGAFVYSLGKNAYLATCNNTQNTVSFSTTVAPVSINTYGDNASYKYYITLSNGSQINFNNHNKTTGVTGSGKDKDAGSLFAFVENTSSSITVDEATIGAINEATKVYTKQYFKEELESTKSHIGELGYPTQEAYDTYAAAIESATNLAQVTTARNTFFSTLKYPEDGKVYYIEGVTRGGKKTGYVFDNGTQLGFGNSLPTTMPGTAEFYCHKLGDRKYMFATLSGKYLMYQTDSESGIEETFSANNNTLTLQPMKYDAAPNYYVANDQLVADKETLGLFLIRGKRAKYVNNNNATDQASVRAKDYYLMAGFTRAQFHAGGSTEIYYTSENQTSAFKFVEAPQHNAFTTKPVKLSDSDTESYNLATYSSPFATTLPDGVKAYTVISDKADYKLKKLTLTNQVLPAHTGVILATDEENRYVPVAATEAPTAPEGNLLQATDGAATTVAEGINAYIFTKNSQGVALFGQLSSNTDKRKVDAFKSYLTVAGDAAPSLQLSFGDNVTTGIATAVAEADNAPQVIYDLSGRRVQQIKNAGVYIINGQKRVIK